MFRIILDPRRGVFIVQLQAYGFLWKTIKQEHADSRPTDRTFPTYADAEKFVEAVGLRSVYRDYRETPRYHIMQGGQMQYQDDQSNYHQNLPRVVRSHRA